MSTLEEKTELRGTPFASQTFPFHVCNRADVATQMEDALVWDDGRIAGASRALSKSNESSVPHGYVATHDIGGVVPLGAHSKLQKVSRSVGLGRIEVPPESTLARFAISANIHTINAALGGELDRLSLQGMPPSRRLLKCAVSMVG
jgi:hypothetical protein